MNEYKNYGALIKYYIFGVPYCIGLIVWYTITLRPSEGLFLATIHSMSQFFRHVALYDVDSCEEPVMHLFNREEDLIKSMKSYVEDSIKEKREG